MHNIEYSDWKTSSKKGDRRTNNYFCSKHRKTLLLIVIQTKQFFVIFIPYRKQWV